MATSTVQAHGSWYQQYLRQARGVIKDIAFKCPDVVEFPVTFKKTMFEFGGSAKNFGSAMIIADAKGYPSQGRIDRRPIPNGLQAEISVWPGCLVGAASHDKGREVFTIYKITSVTDSEDRNSFGCVSAKLVAYYRSNTSYSGSTKDTWYDNLKKEYWCIDKFAQTLEDKLYTISCVKPSYIEWFKEVPKSQMLLRSKFYDTNLDWYISGVCDKDTEPQKNSDTFSEFYNSIVDRAYELSKKSRIVMAIIAHYFASVDSSNSVTMFAEPEKEDLSEATLVSEARLFTLNSYTRDPEVFIDNYVYTYVHKLDSDTPKYLSSSYRGEEPTDSEDKVINVNYFLSDHTFREFTSKHPGDYIDTILNRKFYQDIKHNLNPQPHPVRSKKTGQYLLNADGTKKLVTPSAKSHPDTQTNILLYIGTAKAYFNDVRDNIFGGSSRPRYGTPVKEDTGIIQSVTMSEEDLTDSHISE